MIREFSTQGAYLQRGKYYKYRWVITVDDVTNNVSSIILNNKDVTSIYLDKIKDHEDYNRIVRAVNYVLNYGKEKKVKYANSYTLRYRGEKLSKNYLKYVKNLSYKNYERVYWVDVKNENLQDEIASKYNNNIELIENLKKENDYLLKQLSDLNEGNLSTVVTSNIHDIKIKQTF